MHLRRNPYFIPGTACRSKEETWIAVPYIRVTIVLTSTVPATSTVALLDVTNLASGKHAVDQEVLHFYYPNPQNFKNFVL
jgi:hypothetical protein